MTSGAKLSIKPASRQLKDEGDCRRSTKQNWASSNEPGWTMNSDDCAIHAYNQTWMSFPCEQFKWASILVKCKSTRDQSKRQEVELIVFDDFAFINLSFFWNRWLSLSIDEFQFSLRNGSRKNRFWNLEIWKQLTIGLTRNRAFKSCCSAHLVMIKIGVGQWSERTLDRVGVGCQNNLVQERKEQGRAIYADQDVSMWKARTRMAPLTSNDCKHCFRTALVAGVVSWICACVSLCMCLGDFFGCLTTPHLRCGQ